MDKIKTEFSAFIDTVIESKRADYKNDLEPFHIYAHKVKDELMTVYDDSVTSIQHGYEVIINKIASQMGK